MSINYESVNEQLTSIVNQLAQLRRLFQRQIELSNSPTDLQNAAQLREEIDRLRMQLVENQTPLMEQQQSAAGVRTAIHESDARLAVRTESAQPTANKDADANWNSQPPTEEPKSKGTAQAATQQPNKK